MGHYHAESLLKKGGDGGGGEVSRTQLVESLHGVQKKGSETTGNHLAGRPAWGLRLPSEAPQDAAPRDGPRSGALHKGRSQRLLEIPPSSLLPAGDAHEHVPTRTLECTHARARTRPCSFERDPELFRGGTASPAPLRTQPQTRVTRRPPRGAAARSGFIRHTKLRAAGPWAITPRTDVRRRPRRARGALTLGL